MCNFFSCIVTTSGDVLFDPMSDNHERIIEQNKDKYDLRDDTVDPDKLRFARVEIMPPYGDVFVPLDEWQFHIDQSIVPTWFTDVEKNKALKTAETFIENHIFVDKKNLDLRYGRFWLKSSSAKLYDSSSAVLYGSSSAELYDSSSAELYDSSRAVLYDSSRAVLCGSSSAELYDSSSAVLYDSSSVELYGSSSAILYSSSSAKLYDSSSAVLYGSSSAELYDSSSAELYDSSRAVLYDSSRAVLCGSSSAVLCGSSSAELYDSSSAVLYDSRSRFISINNDAVGIDRSGNIPKILVAKKGITLTVWEDNV